MSRADTDPTTDRRTLLRALGAGAGGLAATAGPATAQGRPDFGGWLEGVDGGFRDARGQASVTVEVGAQGNGGAFAFSPAGLWVDPGTTIRWEWTGEGGGHNVHAVEGASFQSEIVAEAGHTFEHTFGEAGIVKYQCDPHASLGMKGAVAVGDDVPMASAGGKGGGGRPLPGGDIGAAFMAIVLGTAGIAAVSVLAGEAYGAVRRGRAAAPETVEPAEPEAPAREIDHDEFDPVGTAALVVLYVLILVVLWIFVYFVEFLGNGPTVIG